METYKIALFIITSGLLWLVYRLLLSNQKTLKFNRYFLLISVVVSLFIPFVHLNYFSGNPLAQSIPIYEIPVLEINAAHVPKTTPSFSWQKTILYGYLLTSCVLLLRFLWNLILIQIRIFKSKKVSVGGIRYVLLPNSQPPFCFLKYIFVSEKEFIHQEIEEDILNHEKTHAREKHSYDVLFMEFVLTFTWFNPFFWLLRKAIIANHEFLADHSTLEKSADQIKYRQLIVSNIVGPYHNQFASNFNFLLTKKRFIMMSKNTPKKKARILKFAGMLLLIATIGIGISVNAMEKPSDSNTFAAEKTAKAPDKLATDAENFSLENAVAKEVQGNISPESKTNLTDTLREKKDTVMLSLVLKDVTEPKFSGGLNNFRELFSENFDTSSVEDSIGIVRTVLSFAVDIDGSVSDYKTEGENEAFNQAVLMAVKRVNENGKWFPGEKDGKPVKSRFRMPIAMNFGETPESVEIKHGGTIYKIGSFSIF